MLVGTCCDYGGAPAASFPESWGNMRRENGEEWVWRVCGDGDCVGEEVVVVAVRRGYRVEVEEVVLGGRGWWGPVHGGKGSLVL